MYYFGLLFDKVQVPPSNTSTGNSSVKFGGNSSVKFAGNSSVKIGIGKVKPPPNVDAAQQHARSTETTKAAEQKTEIKTEQKNPVKNCGSSPRKDSEAANPAVKPNQAANPNQNQVKPDMARRKQEIPGQEKIISEDGKSFDSVGSKLAALKKHDNSPAVPSTEASTATTSTKTSPSLEETLKRLAANQRLNPIPDPGSGGKFAQVPKTPVHLSKVEEAKSSASEDRKAPPAAPPAAPPGEQKIPDDLSSLKIESPKSGENISLSPSSNHAEKESPGGGSSVQPGSISIGGTVFGAVSKARPPPRPLDGDATCPPALKRQKVD